MEKDLDIVVHESKEKTEETGLETVELSNEGKSAWFNLKDTAILQVIHLHKIKRVFMGVFLSLSRTWIFKIESDALPMCWGPRATKNLDKRACIQTFPQSPQSSFTVIHPINATGLFIYQGCSGNLLVVWCHNYSLLSFLPFWVCNLHISGSNSFLNTPLSLSQTSKTASRQCRNKSLISPLNPQKPRKSQQQPLCFTRSNIAL